MKGRAHRLQSVDPHDDWVDGSWTVDCVCGVNFDDGEEMVNCDECGVWVHTRCSRYTKGDELFTCDKCKSKGNRNNSEETEVAQLLVELPTKTVKLESSYAAPAPPRRPFRLWTEIPMEERVHVQGVPGGDPSLFGGLSGVFTPELWKCSGYVPKKFNFQCREFPCWDGKKEDSTKNDRQNDNEIGNLVDNGAGVLFSLSKERVLGATAYRRKEASKEVKKREVEVMDVRRSQNGARKDRNILRPLGAHSSKRKKDDLGVSRDRSGKKKVRTHADKETDEKKRSTQSFKTVFRLANDGKQLEFYEDRGPKSFETDVQSVKNKNLKDNVLQELTVNGNLEPNNGAEKPRDNLLGIMRTSEASPSDASGHTFTIKTELKEEKVGHQFPVATKSSPKTDDVVAPLPECRDFGSAPVKEEDDSTRIDKLDGSGESYARNRIEHPVEETVSATLEVEGNRIIQDLRGHTSQSSIQSEMKVKMEVNGDNSNGVSNVQSSSSTDAKDLGILHYLSETSKTDDALASSLGSKVVARTSEQPSNHHSNGANKSFSDPCQQKQDLERLEGSESAQKNSPEIHHPCGYTEEPSKLNPNVLTSQAQSSQHKMVARVENSSCTASSAVNHTSFTPDSSKSTDTQDSSLNTKLRVMPDCSASIRKDRAGNDAIREDDQHDLSQKTVKEKERLKSSVTYTSKASQQSRIPPVSSSKRASSESKDSMPSSSSKASSAQNTVATAGSAESAGSMQNQSVSHVQQNKSNFLPNCKVNHGSAMHPPATSNSHATLSDEELALLLHQELNSSPRVPRVPRVRHAGSFPQLASPTATSMLIKRTSSAGGKDHSSISRRKNKDSSRDGSRGSRELDDETKKVDKMPSSPDRRRQDVGYAADPSTKREDKNVPPASMTTSSGPSSSMEANDQNLSSVRNSPRNISDDDTGTARGPVPRTLPGLINEIMSKGRRMTYEELCDAVLPHWPYLRKHNGERYAYSSHSQAVLDCLRNRHEWAQLVDRGPKTNSSRKKRKEESEDNEYSRGRITKDLDTEGKSLESQREEFPKGKRKARKRRRLALQGRGIKDVQRRRKADFTDDDTGPFSNSSEESMFSEDEVQGVGACPAGSEASASSEELETL